MRVSAPASRWPQRKKGAELADPVPEGRPAGATAANAYTLNLWAGGEGRTLTERAQEEMESKRRLS